MWLAVPCVLLVERVDRAAVRVIRRWAPGRACGSAVWLVVGWAAGGLRVWLRVLLAGVGLSVWLSVRLSARVAAEAEAERVGLSGVVGECAWGWACGWLRLSAARGWLGLGLGPALGVCPIGYAQPQKKKT